MAAAAGLVLAVAGCGTAEDRTVLDAPIDLYHDLQGGTIASQRPPPPGVGQPYPGLASVPARPTPTTAADRRAIYAALAAERDRVGREDARDPLALRPGDMPPSPSAPPPPAAAPAPPQAPAAPGSAPVPTGAAADDSAPSVAVLPAADAPPAKPDRSAARPVAPPGPLPELDARVTEGGPVPPIPDAPPAPPALEGAAAPVAQPGAAAAVNVYFRRGSAAVPLDAGAALRALAAARHDRAIDVRAPGEPAGRGPDGTAAGLPLGLRRAEAIAAVLTDAGVPPDAVRVLAAGTGQQGIARVVDRN